MAAVMKLARIIPVLMSLWPAGQGVLAPGQAMISVDGGYADIVIKINRNVCKKEEDCLYRVKRLKVKIIL